MTTIYSNPLNLFNLTAKASPVGADLVPIGDSAVTGLPLKQATITSILALAGSSKLTINTQSGNYSLVSGDLAKIIYGTKTTSTTMNYTLLAPATAGAGWWCYIENQSTVAGGHTAISPASGNINGVSTFYLQSGNSCIVYTDGSNYFTMSTTQVLNNGVAIGQFVAQMPGQFSSTLSDTQTQSQASVLNTAVLAWPFYVPNNCQTAFFFIDVVTQVAASEVTVGLYADNGFGQRPAAAAALGAVAITTTSNGKLNGTLSINLQANNIYWVAIQANTSTTLALGNVLINMFNSSSGSGTGTYNGQTLLAKLTSAYSSGTLPTWSGSATQTASYVPWVNLQLT